jgi:hypothetical protein
VRLEKPSRPKGYIMPLWYTFGYGTPSHTVIAFNPEKVRSHLAKVVCT